MRKWCDEGDALRFLQNILPIVGESHEAGKAGMLKLQSQSIHGKRSKHKVNISHCFHQIHYYTFEKRIYVLT